MRPYFFRLRFFVFLSFLRVCLVSLLTRPEGSSVGGGGACDITMIRIMVLIYLYCCIIRIVIVIMIRGTIVNRTYGAHKNLPGTRYQVYI